MAKPYLKKFKDSKKVRRLLSDLKIKFKSIIKDSWKLSHEEHTINFWISVCT